MARHDSPESERGGSRWKAFLQRWIINTLAVVVAVYIVDGIDYQKWPDLLIASLVLGILNSVLRPVLMLLSLPLLLLTLGLFMLVINAFTLWIAGLLLRPHFTVEGFGPAFVGALIISIVSLVLNSVTGTGSARVQIRRGRRSHPVRDDGRNGGDGPVIDV